ncbi:sulfatase [Paenibacillus sp. YYML68]|uniref:sulfatase family protein n=1 Tax=Paenibacillus sp. YYML68 TaxID=2909250 RepID=UPI0024932F41|nr:sulfatase-like hydrolase/transferase [Paenibacillus sp. YYML68]
MKPNFLIFVVDQMQAQALSLHGHPDVQTPHLDQLGAEGVSLFRAYCSNPVCMPSRATLLTGLTPRQHGCLTNGNAVPEHLPTLPGVLAEHGYRTHAIGKLHHQPIGSVNRGEELDFSWEDRKRWEAGEIDKLPDGYYGYQTTELVGGHVDVYGEYTRWLEQQQPMSSRQLTMEGAYKHDPSVPMSWRIGLPEELHYNRWIARRTEAFLEQLQPDEAFYLWCSFPDPHHPFAACRPYSEMYDSSTLTLPANWETEADSIAWLHSMRGVHPSHTQFDEQALREILAQTYGMITHVDSCIGQIVAKLKEQQLYDNTVIVFLADHGEYLGSHHLITKAEWPWEELLRVPFIWKSPQSAAQGMNDRHVASLLDFVPTILDFAGIDPAEMDTRGVYAARPLGLPGRSLRTLVEFGVPMPARPALVEYDEDWYAPDVCRMRALITEQYKLVVYIRSGEGLLFDLQHDPYEQVNLWSDPAYAHIRHALTEQLLMELIRTDRFDTKRVTGA